MGRYGCICSICSHFLANPAVFHTMQGNLAAEYSTDGSHVLGRHYADWVQWVREQE
ncbi:hypothetical protein [Roseburia sp. 1XD42-69]|uniref:hypothetical protein n=1 Tax=Roseburia sp. 1XD42-69 TaxID=2320088 RepID=UPI001314035B|nr:hypothetical protein [Roseburia sp. 1XD42-69]